MFNPIGLKQDGFCDATSFEDCTLRILPITLMSDHFPTVSCHGNFSHAPPNWNNDSLVILGEPELVTDHSASSDSSSSKSTESVLRLTSSNPKSLSGTSISSAADSTLSSPAFVTSMMFRIFLGNSNLSLAK
jgi:hypothetical protein